MKFKNVSYLLVLLSVGTCNAADNAENYPPSIQELYESVANGKTRSMNGMDIDALVSSAFIKDKFPSIKPKSCAQYSLQTANVYSLIGSHQEGLLTSTPPTFMRVDDFDKSTAKRMLDHTKLTFQKQYVDRYNRDCLSLYNAIIDFMPSYINAYSESINKDALARLEKHKEKLEQEAKSKEAAHESERIRIMKQEELLKSQAEKKNKMLNNSTTGK